MTGRRSLPRCASLVAALALASLLPSAQAATRSAPAVDAPGVVVAVLGEAGANLLHDDFARTGVVRPAGMPAATRLSLPTRGTFQERLDAARRGPLGHLERNRLYTVDGTSIVGLIAPTSLDGTSDVVTSQPPTVDVLADRRHGTGVLSALAGRRHGTARDVSVVVVLGVDEAAWRWVADQSWIDLVSTSFSEIPYSGRSRPADLACPVQREISDLTARGGLLFAANGNVQAHSLLPPASSPEAHHVGGTNADGSPVLVQADGSVTPDMTASRGYDTGELYSFQAADDGSLSGSMPFGGTSGATPRTAGRAANLLLSARRLLHQSGPAGAGLLASSAQRRYWPRQGPLADGALTPTELSELLDSVATPYFPYGAAGFPLEGFGALSAGSELLAVDVLAGRRPQPERLQERQLAAANQQLRKALTTGRC